MKTTAGRPTAKRGSGAFTLTEIMIAVALCAMALVSIYAGIGFCYSRMDVIRKQQRATQIMLQTFELVRLYNWDQLKTAGYLPNSVFANETNIWTSQIADLNTVYTGRVVTGPAPINASYSGDLMLVTVELEWKAGDVKRTKSMNTLVARQGLQTYVY